MLNKTIQQQDKNLDYSLFSIYVDYLVLFKIKKVLFKKILKPDYNRYNILPFLIELKNKYPECNICILVDKSVLKQYKNFLIYTNFEFTYKVYSNNDELKNILFLYKPAYYFTIYDKINLYPRSVVIDKLFDSTEFINKL